VAYPFAFPFDTAPAAGYTSVLGGMSAVYNGSQQAIDLAATSTQSILRFNETADGDFWCEADLELLTDPSGRKAIGLWMTTGHGAEGYRFAHMDGGWSVSRWTSGFGDGTAVTGTVNDGAKPIASFTGTAPSFAVGERRVLRAEVIVGALDGSGVPWARLLQFKVGGVLLFQVGDGTHRGKLIPGVFLYGATARLHALAGGTPSGLPVFPASLAVKADADLMRRHSPASDRWDRPGGYDWDFHPLEAGRRDIHFGGPGVITGTVKEKGSPDQPLERRVLLVSENTRVLVAETWSDAAGQYRFESLDPAQRYTVVSYDHLHLYRAVIADRLRPELMP